ncbi:GerA spore germination protein [Laceyella sediminis]|uniref:GerA spore germination protein n=1 Tax=Laceyella sediminis TaxID=573074 RepID=A0ABX5EKV3_9BACL|nr:spore germination protein [Laceyella sediminis]PRZ12497.1 GerA spore germination protein [Laceyella sediminis]
MIIRREGVTGIRRPRKNKQETAEPPSTWAEPFWERGDFTHTHHANATHPYWITHITSLVDTEVLHRDILPYLNKLSFPTLQEVESVLPIEEKEITDDPEKIKDLLLRGYVWIRFSDRVLEGVLARAELDKSRAVSIPQEEFSVVGPKESFVESLTTNLNMVRKRLPIKELQLQELTVGTYSKTKVAVLYIDGVANEENVNTVLQRIKAIKFYQILDSSYISQLITDNSNSIFPQMLDTERPERVAAVLAEGSIVIMVDGSPHALIAPTTLVEFFSAFEDYFINWQMASFFRIVRLFSVLFSILITPIYVAVVTYHYALIPTDLMVTLVTSRSIVPFPPILEAMILELTIELLREAGARLPTKVGQTIGIVGGIVIGTASVQAGLTSNVLLIFVALAALASFTTPVYRMGNAIRLLRFPFLLFAQLWGLIGVAIAFIFVMGHLLRLTSLGRPYLEPIYPLRLKDLRDSFIRLPFNTQSHCPAYLQTQDKQRFTPPWRQKPRDIDE